MVNKFISGLSPKEKKILTFAALVVLVTLFDRLLVAPAMSRLHEIDDSIVKEEMVVGQNLRFLAHRDRIVKEASAFKDFYTKDVRTEEEVIAEFLKKIESLATQSQVELSKVSPSGQDAQKEYIKYLVTLDCTGKFENIANFMYAVNSSKDLLKIEKMTITGNARDAEKVQTNMTISRMIVGEDPAVDAKSLVKVQQGSQGAKDAPPQK